jgi:hypothetical protein
MTGKEPYKDKSGRPIPPDHFDNDFPPPEPRPAEREPDWLDQQIEDSKPPQK